MTLEHSIARIDTELEKLENRFEEKIAELEARLSKLERPITVGNEVPNTNFSMCGCTVIDGTVNTQYDRSKKLYQNMLSQLYCKPSGACEVLGSEANTYLGQDLSHEIVDKSIQQILDYNDSNSRTD